MRFVGRPLPRSVELGDNPALSFDVGVDPLRTWHLVGATANDLARTINPNPTLSETMMGRPESSTPPTRTSIHQKRWLSRAGLQALQPVTGFSYTRMGEGMAESGFGRAAHTID